MKVNKNQRRWLEGVGGGNVLSSMVRSTRPGRVEWTSAVPLTAGALVTSRTLRRGQVGSPLDSAGRRGSRGQPRIRV